MPFKSKLIVFFTIAGVLLSYFLVPFLVGFCDGPYGASFLPIVLCWVFGPPIAGGICAASIKASASIKSAVGTGTAVVLYLAFFIVFPPPVICQTMGFSANFILTKHPEQIQQWATQVLDQYELGKLDTSTNVEYWAVGEAGIKDGDIPPQIKNLWRNKPSIGIATLENNGWITGPMRTNAGPSGLSHCVAISWYETGFLVGRPNFQSTWNPWYLHEIKPGIYVFCGEK